MKDNPFKIQEGLVRDNSIKGVIKDKSIGDYLELKFLSKAEHIGKFFSDQKIKTFFNIFAFFILVLFIRSFYLQIIKGSDFLNIAEGNRIRSDVIQANRGLIYDRFGNLLVKNVSYFFVYLLPDLLPTDQVMKEEFLDDLTTLLDLNKDELALQLEEQSNKASKILIYEDLPYDLAIKLMIMSDDYPALQVSYESRRQYFPELGLAHTLGYLGAVTEEDLVDQRYGYNDRIGKGGIEFIYEDILKGKNGARQIEVDALFRKKNDVSLQEPIDGQDLVLTIDAQAQEKLFEIMSSNAQGYHKPKMAAIVLDVQDGGVLAMTSLPSFDNNIFTSSLNKEDYNQIINDQATPLLNRVIAGTYPLGSIFKLIVGSAALEENIIDTNFKVNSTGGITVGNNFFPDWRSQGHGLTDIYWALADSVNTFFYSIGGGNNQWLDFGLGVDKIVEYAQKFGLGKITGIDLTSEAEGFLPSKSWKQDTFNERWFLGDTYNLSIGQGYLLATPIQAAVFMSYFANNGEVYLPHLLKDNYESKLLFKDIISADTLSTIRQGLRNTVVVGTAQSMQSVPVKVAGKTGTAQFNRNQIPHSWFSGFAPYDDPKIVIVVLVEEGGDIGLAVTISRQFMEWYFSQ